jgi:hypothetical protein
VFYVPHNEISVGTVPHTDLLVPGMDKVQAPT